MMRSRSGERSPRSSPHVKSWLVEPMPGDVKRSIERIARADGVVHVAVMPDVHLASDVCVGVAVATRDWIYPEAVGGDIGCGMLAIAFDSPAEWLRDNRRAANLLERLREVVPPMRHPTLAGAPRLPVELGFGEMSVPALAKLVQREGRVELGTLGRGNHFVEFQADEDDRLWLMIHSGSRCVGQQVSKWHLSRAARRSSGLVALRADEQSGKAYLNDAAWAARYAAANRRAMCNAIIGLLAEAFRVQAIDDSVIECDHNHVRLERHFGELVWVHRKGATSASAGEAAVIPGSMGTRSLHVLGRGCEEALRSSSHGAGRAMSRSDASRRISVQALASQMGNVQYDESVARRLREEAPDAYKDINAVMRAQRALTKIVRRLTPVLVYKAV